jgi:tetratricopeptide (TPR) repeat protein
VGEGRRNEISGGYARNVVQAQSVNEVHFTQADSGPLPRPQQLPPVPAGFVNRDAELGVLDGLLTGPVPAASPRASIVVITGMPGVGKTSLALHWAERVREHFPDGHLYVNLHGYDTRPPATAGPVLDSFLRALDIPLAKLPVDPEALTGLYRSVLHGRRALIILDNARTAEQVRPLLAPSSCLVVITSRSRLSGLVIREGATRLTLNPLHPRHALRLITSVMGGPLTDSDSQAAAVLAEQCAYLPLALRIAAERVALSIETGIAVLADEIGAERSHLNAYTTVLDDESTEVRSVFSWSYHGLSPQAAQMFRLLGLQTGSTFTGSAAAALAAVPPAEAHRILGMLADLNLVERAGRDRYRFHDLLRAYAAELAEAEDPPDKRADAVSRLVSWYLTAADAADRVLAPLRRHVLADPVGVEPVPPLFEHYDQALAWCEEERENLLAAVSLAAASGRHDLAWKLAVSLVTFFYLRKYRTDWLTTVSVALDSARRIGDQQGEAWSLLCIGGALEDLHRSEEAITFYQQSLNQWQAAGDSYGEIMALSDLSEACHHVGQHQESIEYGERAFALAEGKGNRRQVAIILNVIGETYYDLGKFTDAANHSERALHAGHGVDEQTEGWSLRLLGNSLRQIGQPEGAAKRYNQALLIQHKISDRYGEAETLRSLAKAQQQLNDLNGSRESLSAALSIFSALGDPQADITRTELEQLLHDDHTSGT